MNWTVRRRSNGHYELNLVTRGERWEDVFVFQTFPTYEAMNAWLVCNGYTKSDLTKEQ